MSDVPRKWTTGAAAWRHFCETEGQALGLKGNENSWINFYRKHGKALEDCGITRRSPARRTVVADAENFGPAVFDLLTLGELPEKNTAAA